MENPLSMLGLDFENDYRQYLSIFTKCYLIFHRCTYSLGIQDSIGNNLILLEIGILYSMYVGTTR